MKRTIYKSGSSAKFHTPMIKPIEFQTFDRYEEPQEIQEHKNLQTMKEVPLQISVELGRTQKKCKEILELHKDSLLVLNKLAGEPMDILVNNKYTAKGEIMIMDGTVGTRITQITNPENRLIRDDINL